MNLHPKQFILLALCGLTFTQVFAATAPKHLKATKEVKFDSSVYNLPEINEDKLLTNLKNSEMKRKPANSMMLDESMMSPKLLEITKKLHTLKTSEDVDSFITELDKNYNSLPNDAKYYVAQLVPMTAFRGIFYKLRPMFENKANMLHTQVLTFAKGLATQSNVYLPYDYADASFQYISSPFYNADGSMAATFSNEEDLKNHIATRLIPALQTTVKRLEELNLETPVIWDQRLVNGENAFKDNIGRFKLIGEFEKDLALSSYYGSLSSLATVSAYNLNGSVQLFKEVGYLFGFDGFGPFNKVDGVTMEKITKVVNRPQFKNWGTLRSVDGQSWMNYSLLASRKSLKRLQVAWKNSTQERKNEDLYLVNVNYLNIDREKLDRNLEMVSRIVLSPGKESLRSAVTGEVIEVNYSNMFTNPPRDIKVFLPTSFVSERNETRMVSFANGSKKQISYRNYNEGRGNSWRIDQIQNYFPSVKSNEDVNKTARVLNAFAGDWLTIQ